MNSKMHAQVHVSYTQEEINFKVNSQCGKYMYMYLRDQVSNQTEHTEHPSLPLPPPLSFHCLLIAVVEEKVLVADRLPVAADTGSCKNQQTMSG